MSVKTNAKINAAMLPETIEGTLKLMQSALPKDIIRKINMSTNSNDILEILNKMNEAEREEFEKKQAEFICNEIKEKVAKNPSMDLLKEEVLEDGSVVITISV